MSAPVRSAGPAALAAAVVAALVTSLLSRASRAAHAVWVAEGWAGLWLSPTLFVAALALPEEEGRPAATIEALKRYRIADVPAPRAGAPGGSLHAALTTERAETELPAEELAAWLDSLPPRVTWGVLPHDPRHALYIADLRALTTAPLRGSLHLSRAALHTATGAMGAVTRVRGEGWCVLLRALDRVDAEPPAVALEPGRPHALVCAGCGVNPGADASEAERDARARARRWRHEDTDAGRVFTCRACIEGAR